MSRGTSAHTITFYVRPNVLWRQSRWQCGYEYVSSRWTSTLYRDDFTVAEAATDSLAAMLLLAECWRRTVKSDERRSTGGRAARRRRWPRSAEDADGLTRVGRRASDFHDER